MQKVRSELAGIKFGEIDGFHQFEVQNLAQEMGVELALESEDSLSFLADWKECADNPATSEKAEAIYGRILHANELGRKAAKRKR